MRGSYRPWELCRSAVPQKAREYSHHTGQSDQLSNIIAVWLSACTHGHRNFWSNVNMQGLWFVLLIFREGFLYLSLHVLTSPYKRHWCSLLYCFFMILGKDKKWGPISEPTKSWTICVTRNMQTGEHSPWQILWKNHSGWGAINQQFIYARFQTRFLKTSIIQRCFLTEEHSE